MFLSVDVEHYYFVTLGKYLISVNLSLPVESFLSTAAIFSMTNQSQAFKSALQVIV